jgi:CheY-like chemotaxis protein
LQICGEAENGRQAVDQVRELYPDVVAIDISMPVMDGLRATMEIRRIAPATKIVLFSIPDGPQAQTAARMVGADAGPSVCLRGDRLSQFTRQAGRYGRHFEIIPGGTDYWTGLFAQEKRATIAVTTRNRSKTPRPNEELSATPYAAVKETSAKTSNASVMQTDKSKGPKPCDCCLQTQREALITMAKRTRTSAMLRAIPMEDRILRPAAEGRQAADSILESESDIVKRPVPALFARL